MLPASAEYIAYEVMASGAMPEIRAVFFPYLWPDGINNNGSFTHCAFITSERIQADFEGFVGGEWISEIVSINLQVPTSPVVTTFILNYPGYEAVFYYRAAESTALLAAASWTPLTSGDTIQIQNYYQFRLTLEGYRAWAEDSLADANDYTAWAEDTIYEDAYQGYAADTTVSGDSLTYIRVLVLLGEFAVVRDIAEAGNLTIEAPTDFDDLVAGSHSGLVLSNGQGSGAVTVLGPGEIDYTWTPAPLFSPLKSSFFLAGQDWYDNLMLRIDLGWSKGGWFQTGFLEDEWLTEIYTDFVTLFLGRVKEFGPVNRALGSPNTAEVYAESLVSDCLKKRICLPAADGTPAPKTYGEFLVKADLVSGWSPAPIIKSAYFEDNDFNELSRLIESGGGVASLVTPGITGTRSFRAVTSGANQEAGGALCLRTPGEILITGSMRFMAVPGATVDGNLTFLQIIDQDGSVEFTVAVGSDWFVNTPGNVTNFNVQSYLEVPIPFALWMLPGANGKTKFWLNGDEILNGVGDLTGVNPLEIRFGAATGAGAEAWTIDFDDLELRNKFYSNAFRVTGGPFESIGPVYIDDAAQPDSKVVKTFTQTVTRYPLYGMVQFESTDPEFELSGDVMFRVIENAGGRHALYMIEDILAEVGLTDYIDATALAAAYVACPDDILNARFEGGSNEKTNFGLKDTASLGIPAADCIKEICSRMMYWFFDEAGEIKIVPYTGVPPGEETPPVTPALYLTASNKWENSQTIDLKNVNAFVSAVYGWCARNPSLFYLTGTQEAGKEGTTLDYSWDSPVATENRDLVKAKVDLLFRFLSAQEIIDPVITTLLGARVELMKDVINLADDLLSNVPRNYWAASKEVGLDPGNQNTTLRLIRFLGET